MKGADANYLLFCTYLLYKDWFLCVEGGGGQKIHTHTQSWISASHIAEFTSEQKNQSDSHKKF